MRDDSHAGLPLLAMDFDVMVWFNVRECLAAARAQMAPHLTPAERFAIEFQIAAISWHMARAALAPRPVED